MEYEKVLKNPEKEINKIIIFLDINPSKKQINNAINSVDPKEKHFW